MSQDKLKATQRKITYSNARAVAAKQTAGFERTSFSLPKGVELFNPEEEGNYIVDVIPYFVGKNNPMADEGTVHYERTFYVHTCGVENRKYCCLKQTFNQKKCPVCDHQNVLRQEGKDYDLIKSMYPKKRQLWRFKLKRTPKDKNPDQTIQVYESSYYLGLGEMLNTELQLLDEDHPFQRFFHLDGGMSLVLQYKKSTFEGRNFMKLMKITPEPRVKSYSADVLDEPPCLDECLKELTYKQLHAIYHQTDEGDDEETKDKEETLQHIERGSPTKIQESKEVLPPVDEDEDVVDGDDEEMNTPAQPARAATTLSLSKGALVEHFRLGMGEVVSVGPDGKTLKFKDEDGDEHTVKVADCTLVK